MRLLVLQILACGSLPSLPNTPASVWGTKGKAAVLRCSLFLKRKLVYVCVNAKLQLIVVPPPVLLSELGGVLPSHMASLVQFGSGENGGFGGSLGSVGLPGDICTDIGEPLDYLKLLVGEIFPWNNSR